MYRFSIKAHGCQNWLNVYSKNIVNEINLHGSYLRRMYLQKKSQKTWEWANTKLDERWGGFLNAANGMDEAVDKFLFQQLILCSVFIKLNYLYCSYMVNSTTQLLIMNKEMGWWREEKYTFLLGLEKGNPPARTMKK